MYWLCSLCPEPVLLTYLFIFILFFYCHWPYYYEIQCKNDNMPTIPRPIIEKEVMNPGYTRIFAISSWWENALRHPTDTPQLTHPRRPTTATAKTMMALRWGNIYAIWGWRSRTTIPTIRVVDQNYDGSSSQWRRRPAQPPKVKRCFPSFPRMCAVSLRHMTTTMTTTSASNPPTTLCAANKGIHVLVRLGFDSRERALAAVKKLFRDTKLCTR